MTVKELIANGKNYTEKERKTILCFLLDCSFSDLFFIDDVDDKISSSYLELVKSNLPIQYLLHYSNFYGYDFYVDESVLIPRPETELLVDKCLSYINNYFNSKKISICDLGTGSGCIAITLKKEIPFSSVTAVDISTKALKVAIKNARINKVSINFIKSNMLDKVDCKFDVIVSNPPYIAKKDIESIDFNVLKYEPHLALFGGEDGLLYYKKILQQAKKNLKEKSLIALEIGYDEKEKVIEIAKNFFPNATIKSFKDLNNYDRYIFILNNFE